MNQDSGFRNPSEMAETRRANPSSQCAVLSEGCGVIMNGTDLG